MDRRLELDAKLSAITGVKDAYYTQPTNVKMKYPCIRYSKTAEKVRFSNNGRFVVRDRYTITAIDYTPDSQIFEDLSHFQFFSFDRIYTADGLYHFVCTIYY